MTDTANLSNSALAAWQRAHPNRAPLPEVDRAKWAGVTPCPQCGLYPPAHANRCEHNPNKGFYAMTQTPTPEKVTAAELRASLADLRAELDTITERLDTLTNAVQTIAQGIQHAATATPPPAQAGQFAEMEITSIVKTIDKNNKLNYLAIGVPYAKFGVRVWDEVIPHLGIDINALAFGSNTIEPIRARVLLGPTKNKETGKEGIGPHKVTGKA